MPSPFSRRDALRLMGLGSASMAFPFESWTRTIDEQLLAPNPLHVKLSKPITAITLGAGARGNTYGSYALKNQDQVKIVGVAEPIPIRNERYSKKHNIEDAMRFTTWEHVLQKPKMADAVIITMPDHLHYEPCMQALALGYDVLLEKPMAQTEQQCRNILKQVKKTGRIVAICHVLRYSPYFIKLRQMIQSGAIGDLISIQHFEPIEHVHMAHSFVRGNWHDSKATTPIILAKSCHDLDIMRWLVGKPSEHISAFGDLSWFRLQNAPEGSTARCHEGCKIESSCPYSALKIYHRKRIWTYVFDLPEDKAKQGDAILDYLKTTNYGRCVYRMENDQPDHIVSTIQFEGGITASFNMEAFTSYGGRRTRVMGSMGDIVGDMEKFTYTDFRTDQTKDWDMKIDDDSIYKNSGHGGGDFRLMSDWVQAVAQHNPNLLTSTIDASIESHIMGFAAERSRKSKKTIKISL
ncbi:MAG TPA: Gfo/Idh/MocA family oxidoreductase [Saprospiraceae bacterium]|nr:Gfo/Idh/MocA family oxidoreductase [Saprospiraceae bacterium]